MINKNELRIPKELEQRLEKLTQKTGVPKDVYIVEAIQEFLDAHEENLLIKAHYDQMVESVK